MTALVNPGESADANVRIGRAVAMAMAAMHRRGTEIAEVLHISTASLSARLNGHTPFRADELIALGRHLGVDPGQFLSDAPVFPLCGECDFSVIDGSTVHPYQLQLVEPPVLTAVP
jgi:hypothetical protein